MDSYKLSFGKINKLNDSIAEIIVDEGVEMDLKMVKEYHIWIAEHLLDPCGLLINKINRYTYTFEAQRELANLPQIKAMAVITYNTVSTVSTKVLSKMPRKNKWNLEMFEERNKGLEWLKKEIRKFID